LVDRDEAMTHPQFRQKLEAVGYGVFIPIFFVATARIACLGACVSERKLHVLRRR
jgi:Kef-type K+ transport system membrane component KefB